MKEEIKKRTSSERPVLVTSALPYANGSIHIGHLVEYIQTDIWVRFLKLVGRNAIYCCADDTHGAPIEINASKQGISPEELIAKYFKEHTEDFSRFFIEFDSYYSTNSEENRYYAELIFSRLKDGNHIITKEEEHTYCEHCRRFLPDRYVKGKCPKCGAEDQYGDVCEKCNATYSTVDLVDPYCVICHNRPVRKRSRHYYFQLSHFSGFLREWISSNEELQPEVKNHVLSWIDEGLEDWCISRDGPYFGFKIPGEEDKYFYVWLDAPIGYISSTANYCRTHGNSCSAEDYWVGDRADIYHFIGKDIIYFHLLFWPAMLKASGFNLPKNVFVHGFLTVNHEKMSKSRGTFLTAREFLQFGNPEHLRYYYAANLGRSMTDIDLDFDDYVERINNELVANIANFVYRTLSFINRNFDGKIGSLPDLTSVPEVKELKSLYEQIRSDFESVQFRSAVNGILRAGSIGNRYFQDNEPWKLVKEDRSKALSVLTLAANMVRNLAVLLKPVLPKYAESIERQLNLNGLSWSDIGFDLQNRGIGKAEMYFSKIGPVVLSSGESPLDLRVAIVEDVKDHPDADKLYVLSINLGSEKRQLVAGLKGHYSPDELLGKRLVVVANLEPAVLRGVKSEGMLLAADSGGSVGVLIVPDAEPGMRVLPEGFSSSSSKRISFKEFQKIKLEAKDGVPLQDGRPLLAEKGNIVIDRGIASGRIR